MRERERERKQLGIINAATFSTLVYKPLTQPSPGKQEHEIMEHKHSILQGMEGGCRKEIDSRKIRGTVI